MKYNATVNGNRQFKLSVDQEIFLDDQKILLDILHSSEDVANIIYNDHSFNVEIVSLDRIAKTAMIKVNGSIYQVELKDQYDALLKDLGIDNLNSQKIQQIKAPMPGLVLSLYVNEGDEVKKGDSLLVLEAMKMENILKSPTDGIIQKIEIEKGDKVEKNQNLIRFA